VPRRKRRRGWPSPQPHSGGSGRRPTKTPPIMATDIPASITTPDKVKTRLGTLRFSDGFPTTRPCRRSTTISTSSAASRRSSLPPGCAVPCDAYGRPDLRPDNQTVQVSETLLDSHSLMVTGNTETVYTIDWLDTKGGPLVVVLPPGVLGILNDFWCRCVSDVGLAGPDAGAGGKYLLLPPGYTATCQRVTSCCARAPTGTFCSIAASSSTATLAGGREHQAALPCLLTGPGREPAGDELRQHLRRRLQRIMANDVTFYDEVVPVVQEEPLDACDAETRGLLAAIASRRASLSRPMRG